MKLYHFVELLEISTHFDFCHISIISILLNSIKLTCLHPDPLSSKAIGYFLTGLNLQNKAHWKEYH